MSKVMCECGELYNSSYKSRHENSNKHKKFFQSSNKTVEYDADIDDDNISDVSDGISNKAIDDNFLNELNNENFTMPEVEVKSDVPKVSKRIINKMKKHLDEDVQSVASNDIFSGKPTEILGKDRRVLIAKIKQYKLLFPNELGEFKLKKNPTIDDLNDAINELDAILDTNTVDGFITDGIMQSLKVIEGASSHTRYNISGLSDMLKNNKQFNSLTKQLYLKYQVFSKVPVETQMLFVVATSMYICIQKNKARPALEQYLNQPSNIEI